MPCAALVPRWPGFARVRNVVAWLLLLEIRLAWLHNPAGCPGWQSLCTRSLSRPLART